MGRYLLLWALAGAVAAEDILPAVVGRIRWAAAPITETALFVGTRRITAEEWGGVRDPVQMGLSLNARAWRTPVEAVIAYHQAQGGRDRGVVVGQDPVPTTARRQSDVLLQEVAVGAQAAWELWRFRGTLGVGPAFLRGEVQERTTFSLASQVFNPTRPGVVTTTRAGNGLGTWGAIGGTVAFGQSSLGVQLRRTWVRVPLGDGTADGGGLQAGALVVFRW